MLQGYGSAPTTMGLQGGGASLASIAGNDWVMSMAGIGALSVQSRDLLLSLKTVRIPGTTGVTAAGSEAKTTLSKRTA